MNRWTLLVLLGLASCGDATDKKIDINNGNNGANNGTTGTNNGSTANNGTNNGTVGTNNGTNGSNNGSTGTNNGTNNTNNGTNTISAVITISGEGSGVVTSQPSGIDCPSACTADFSEGSEVTLTATPTEGTEFVAWTGNCSGTDPVLTLTLSAPIACEAEFSMISNALLVNVGPGEHVVGGSVILGDGSMIAVGWGSQVSLTRSRAHIFRLAIDGSVIWAKSIGEYFSGSRLSDVIQLSPTEFVAIGDINQIDGWIVEFNEQGAVSRQRTVSLAFEELELRALAKTGADEYTIVGAADSNAWSGTLTSNLSVVSGARSNQPGPLTRVIPTLQGGAIATDRREQVFMFNPDDSLAWRADLGRSFITYTNSIIETAGGFLAVGEDSSTNKFRAVVVKFDASGLIVWQRDVGPAATESTLYDVVEKADGSFLLFGETSLKAWVVQMDAAGNLINEFAYGSLRAFHRAYLGSDAQVRMTGSSNVGQQRPRKMYGVMDSTELGIACQRMPAPNSVSTTPTLTMQVGSAVFTNTAATLAVSTLGVKDLVWSTEDICGP